MVIIKTPNQTYIPHFSSLPHVPSSPKEPRTPSSSSLHSSLPLLSSSQGSSKILLNLKPKVKILPSPSKVRNLRAKSQEEPNPLKVRIQDFCSKFWIWVFKSFKLCFLEGSKSFEVDFENPNSQNGYLRILSKLQGLRNQNPCVDYVILVYGEGGD